MTLSTKLFTYDARTTTFTAEASDLGAPGFSAGFLLRSHITGKVVPFEYERTERDAENDILWWEFKSASPKLLGAHVVIYND